MELKTYADIIDLHARYAEAFRKRIEDLKRELPKSPEALVSAKRAAIKQAREAEKAVDSARKEANRRFDIEIGHRREVAEKLAREIAEIEGLSKKAAKREKSAGARTRARNPK